MIIPTTESVNWRRRRTFIGPNWAEAATTFLHSGLKNADAQTGTAQTVSATRRYDAFGNVVTSTGIWNGPFGYRSGAKIPPSPENRGEGNESRLVGRNRDAGGFGYQEDATGLKLLGHRYYDSSTGRFLTRDPIKDGRNWFVYCENDPLQSANPTGLAVHHNGKVRNNSQHPILVTGDSENPLLGGGAQRVYLIRPGYMSPSYVDVDGVFIPANRRAGWQWHVLSGLYVEARVENDGLHFDFPGLRWGGTKVLKAAQIAIASHGILGGLDIPIPPSGSPKPDERNYEDPTPLPGMPRRLGSNPVWN